MHPRLASTRPRSMGFITGIVIFALSFHCGSTWPTGNACQPVRRFGNFNLEKISDRTWYQTLRSHSPSRRSKCVARTYRTDHNTMYWVDQTCYNGTYISAKSRTFRKKRTPFYNILNFDDNYLNQFVDTDSKSWILTVICIPYEKSPWVTVLQTNPLANLSKNAGQRIKKYLKLNKLNKLKLQPTTCHKCKSKAPAKQTKTTKRPPFIVSDYFDWPPPLPPTDK